MLKLENQLQNLSRQVQSCTARIKNLEGASSSSVEKQVVKTPPLKQKQKQNQSAQKGAKSGMKKEDVVVPIKPIVFTPEAGNNPPVPASSSNPSKSVETSQEKSGGPIKKRWVHKNN